MKRSATSVSVQAPRRVAESVGWAISRLQDAGFDFDDVAANILAVPRSDLPCISMLFFVGPHVGGRAVGRSSCAANQHCGDARTGAAGWLCPVFFRRRRAARGHRARAEMGGANLGSPACEWIATPRDLLAPAADGLRDLSASGHRGAGGDDEEVAALAGAPAISGPAES